MVQFTTEFFFLVCPTKNIKLKIPRIIKWNAPPEPLIKLNIDDSSLGNPGLASAGSFCTIAQEIGFQVFHYIWVLLPIILLGWVQFARASFWQGAWVSDLFILKLIL